MPSVLMRADGVARKFALVFTRCRRSSISTFVARKNVDCDIPLHAFNHSVFVAPSALKFSQRTRSALRWFSESVESSGMSAVRAAARVWGVSKSTAARWIAGGGPPDRSASS